MNGATASQQNLPTEGSYLLISPAELGPLIAKAGPLCAYAHQGSAATLYKACFDLLFTEYCNAATIGTNVDSILVKIDLMRHVCFEPVSNFPNKVQWKAEMSHRFTLILANQWDQLQALQLLVKMGAKWALRHKRQAATPPDRTARAQALRKYKATHRYMKTGQLGKANGIWNRNDTSQIASPLNDNNWQVKAMELFPYIRTDNNRTPAELTASQELFEAHIEEYLTVFNLIAAVRATKPHKAASSDGWNIDLHLKPVLKIMTDGSHEVRGQLLVQYLKHVLLGKVSQEYLKSVIYQQLVITVNKPKAHPTPGFGLQLRPLQPDPALLKIVSGILVEPQLPTLQAALKGLQLGVKQKSGAALVVLRAQLNVNQGNALLSGDEKNGYGAVNTLTAVARMPDLPVFQAIVGNHGHISKTLYGPDGSLILDSFNALPQGKNTSGGAYSLSRLEGLRAANQVSHGPSIGAITGSSGYIDNVYHSASDVVKTLSAYTAYENFLQQQDSSLNPADAAALLPLIQDPQVLRAFQEQAAQSPSMHHGRILYHPDQLDAEGTSIGTPLHRWGSVVLGAPVGSKEYQRDFMTTKVDEYIQQNQVLREVASHDIQQFFLLLRNCRWHQQLTYFGRLVHPDIMEPLALRYQQAMYSILESVVSPSAPLDEFHKLWLAKSPSSGGLNLFDIAPFNLCGFIAQSVEFEAYCRTTDATYAAAGPQSVLPLIERYVAGIGGWECLPKEWRQDSPTQDSVPALYEYWVTHTMSTDDFKLQKLLHDPLHSRAVQRCDSLVTQQPAIVQHIYASSSEAGVTGMTPFLVMPGSPQTTFTSQQMLTIFCKQFGLQLPLLRMYLQQSGLACPGCKAPLDPYGVHLLNCSRLAVKGTPDPFSRQLLHNSVGEQLRRTYSDCYSCVTTNPKGARSCPRLPDGSIGHLDIGYDLITEGIYVLEDLSVGNPVRQEGATHKKIDILDDIRTRKNKHYRTSITDQLPNTELHITGFSMYGLMCPEVLHKITVIADYVHSQSPDTIDSGQLARRYRKDLACVLHRGIARFLNSRIDLLRVKTNPSSQSGVPIVDIANSLAEECYADRQYLH